MSHRTNVACLTLGLVAIVSVATAPLQAQEPVFEVASVKVNNSGSLGGAAPRMLNGTFRAENVSLKALLAAAYGIPSFRITGPDWIDSDRFDLTAKPPQDAIDAPVMPMLQSLLQERFKLTVHREIKQMAAFDMVAAKGGVRLHPRDPTHTEAPPFKGGAILGGNGSTAQIADALARVVGQPVIDRTGLEGIFTYSVNYTPLSTRPSDSATVSGPPDFFVAIQEQMGLRLESRKQPIEFLLVDHAERVPAPN